MRRLQVMLVVLMAFIGMGMVPSMAQNKAAKTGAEPGQFDFYVLALSWSPAYCANGGDKLLAYDVSRSVRAADTSRFREEIARSAR